MARGVRRSPLEKLQEQLNEVQESIKQYESCLITLKEKEKILQEEMELEEFKNLKSLLAEQGIGLDELKEILESNISTVEEQSA